MSLFFLHEFPQCKMVSTHEASTRSAGRSRVSTSEHELPQRGAQPANSAKRRCTAKHAARGAAVFEAVAHSSNQFCRFQWFTLRMATGAGAWSRAQDLSKRRIRSRLPYQPVPC